MTKILTTAVLPLLLGVWTMTPEARQAQKTARETAKLFHFPHPVMVSIVTKDKMPRPTLLAYTTRLNDGCVLTIETEALKSRGDRLIYHEVCHCVMEYGRIGEWGYTDDPSDKEMKEREKSAKACEAEMLKRGRQ